MDHGGKRKCAVYARVSTGKQGDSVDHQVAQCQEYISRLGPPYDADDLLVYRDEAVSGYYTSVFERAEMKRAIRDAREGRFKLLVFKEVSRVGRDKQENPAIIGMFEQYGVRVIAINDHYDTLNKDNITFDILSVLSEQESRKISSRVSSARRQLARKGRWSGEAPIGYRVGRETRRLEIDPEWCAVPKLIFELYTREGLGTFKIAERLNGEGWRTRGGKRWSREAVGRILRNRAYIGEVVHGARRNELRREYEDGGRMTKRKVQVRTAREEWQVAAAAHDPLVDAETFLAAQRILQARSRGQTPRRAYHPLTGLLRCGRCGLGMVCQKRSFGGRTYRYYICKTYHKYGRSACDQRNVSADRLEGEIVARLHGRLRAKTAEGWTIHADPRLAIVRLEAERGEAEAQAGRLRRAQNDLFRQRELFEETGYECEMLRLKGQIEAATGAIEAAGRQIDGLRRAAERTAAMDDMLEQFLKLEPAGAGLRRWLHEAIETVWLSDEHVTIAYRFMI